MGFITKLKETIMQYGIEAMGRYYSCYRGFIVDNEDPEFLGRVRVRVPAIFGKQVLEKWALPKGMFSGQSIGFFAIPKPGATVWVSFEGGDTRFPVWEYGWFSKGTTPKNAQRLNPNNYIIQTPEGQIIELDDETGHINIKNKAGDSIRIEEGGIFIGNSSLNLGKFLDDLLGLLQNTQTTTSLGPQPFLNVLEYTALKTKINNFLKKS